MSLADDLRALFPAPPQRPVAPADRAGWVIIGEDAYARYFRRPDGGITKEPRSPRALLDD